MTKRYEEVEVGKLVPYARNPRIHSKQQIAQIRASFREFGTIAPIICDETYSILAGHGRLRAAQEEGLETINCVVVEGLTDTQKRAYVITDNKRTENSDWDEELLNVELQALAEADFDMELTGFNQHDIEVLLGSTGAVADDDFDITAALEQASFVELGDVWTVGRHRLICGDSTDYGTIEKLMNGKLANLVVTDPPYNVAFESSAGMSIKNDKMDNDKVLEFLRDSFTNMYTALDKEGSIYVFHADNEGENFRRAFRECGFYLGATCIWKKNQVAMGWGDYKFAHEPVLVGWKANGKHKWYGDRGQTTIWEYDKPLKATTHPTSKPLDLLAKPIQNSSSANSIVLDPFGGSGSTMMTCQQTDRICYMAELDPKYCSVILRRFIEMGGNADEVYCDRGTYNELVIELDNG